MKNCDIYQKNPTTSKLVNEGVASVNDDNTSQALAVLRYELETFVCEGQYEKGISDILETYLKNIDQLQQPAVWISGFFGSGKSHLVKMLRALWIDVVFEDGATARGIATLPQNIRDHLKELDTQARRHGGLQAASGTLGSRASGSVRLALLQIIFKSVGLPEQYAAAQFVMWIKQEGIYPQIRNQVEQNGLNWDEELDNFYVAEGLHSALMQAKPELFPTLAICVETLNNLYPHVQDISSDHMLKSINKALSIKDKFPLTLVILDEVQQFIGEDSQRSMDIQEVVESCSKNTNGKLLFVGTGQTAVTGTSNLKKLEGRFTIRVELSDTDVDAVIRKVILAKKPEAVSPIEKIMQINMGEISRHLTETTIAHHHNDVPYFPMDYPILPVRRRFWENTLRILDQTGTDSQLRNQLSMIHKVIRTNLDKPLGHVIPADYLYFDSAEKLLQTRILDRKVHEKTLTWLKGTQDEQLMGRACGLVFLINKLSSNNNELGISATIDTLADLLVEDLQKGSSELRSKLPRLLEECDLLIRVGDEYRIQTDESVAWNDEFLNQRSILANETQRIETERNDRIRKKFGDIVRKTSLVQGNSKVPRDISQSFNEQLPNNVNESIYVYIRDGWSIIENSVISDARQAGNQSPTIFVFIPKRSADDLRHHLINYKAASATLDRRGISNTPEGNEAKAAMETTKQIAEGKIQELLNDIFSGARVFQGGGNEITGNNLQEVILQAAERSLLRLYPQFQIADHASWVKVYDKARQGSPDALKALGDEGEPAKNPVCKEIHRFIAGGKKGIDIRTYFESPPYGWSGDAIDGGLLVLLIAGLIRAQDERGQSIVLKSLERKSIGKIIFNVEASNITASQRIQIRKLLQKIGIDNIKSGEELSNAPSLIEKMLSLATQAGGEAPKPECPESAFLDDIRRTAGNEQLLCLYNQREELTNCFETWTALVRHIDERYPNWVILKQLLSHATNIQGVEDILIQIKAIEQQRLLLAEPDLVAPQLIKLTTLLRKELNSLDAEYTAKHEQGLTRLKADSNWKQLKREQRYELMSAQFLHEAAKPKIAVQNTTDILNTLTICNLSSFADRVAALSARFNSVVNEAAKMCEPELQLISLPRRTLKTNKDIEIWTDEVKQKLIDALQKGPINIQ